MTARHARRRGSHRLGWASAVLSAVGGFLTSTFVSSTIRSSILSSARRKLYCGLKVVDVWLIVVVWVNVVVWELAAEQLNASCVYTFTSFWQQGSGGSSGSFGGNAELGAGSGWGGSLGSVGGEAGGDAGDAGVVVGGATRVPS